MMPSIRMIGAFVVTVTMGTLSTHAEHYPETSEAYLPASPGGGVLVPQIVMEPREITCIEDRPQTYFQKVPVCRRIPYAKMVTRCTTRLTTEKCKKTVCKQESKPEKSSHTIQVAKMVPKKESVMKTRRVAQQVPCLETQTVCEDCGHWETCECACRCSRCAAGDCCGQCTKKKWIPKLVEREVQVTVMKTQYVDEVYEDEVTRWVPEYKQRKLTFLEYGRVEKKTEEREFTYLVPHQVSETVPVTHYQCITDYEMRECVRMVPTRVTKTVMVPVCRLVCQEMPSLMPMEMPAFPIDPAPAQEPTPLSEPRSAASAGPRLLN